MDGDNEERPIEVVATMPIYYDGIGPVAIVDGMMHTTLWIIQPSTDRPGTTEKVIVGRLVTRVERVEQHRTVIDNAFAMAAEAMKGMRALFSH